MVNRKDFRPTSNTSSGISNKDREIIQQNRKHKIQYELKYSDGQREIVKEKNIDNARNVGLDYARDRRTDLQSVARVNTPKTHNQNRTTTQEYKQINNNSVKIQNYRNAKITELSNRGYDVVEVSKSVDNELYNTEKKYVPPYSSQSKNVPSIHKDKELNNVSKNLDKKYSNKNFSIGDKVEIQPIGQDIARHKGRKGTITKIYNGENDYDYYVDIDGTKYAYNKKDLVIYNNTEKGLKKEKVIEDRHRKIHSSYY